MDNTNTKKEDIDFRELINLSLKNWKWFLLSTIFFMILGIGYLLIKVPVFYVDTAVLLKDKNNKVASPALSMLANFSSLGAFGSLTGSSNLDNEIEIMSTRMLTKKAILNLGMHITCTTKDGLKTIDMYPNFPYLISVDSAQVDTIKESIQFKIIPQKNNQFQIKGKYKSKKFETIISSFPAVIKTPSINVNIDKNPLIPLSNEDQQVKVTINNPNVTTYLLGQKLSIKATSKKTTIIGLGMESENIKKAQDILNQIITIYNNRSAEEQNDEIETTSAFVNERLNLITEELTTIEKGMEAYKLQNNLTDLQTDTKISLEKTSTFEARRIDAQIQLNMIQYLEEYIQDDKNKDKLIPSVGIEDKSLLSVIVQYNALLTEKNGMESSSSAFNPALTTIKLQLNSMRQNILANFLNVEESLAVTIKGLDKQNTNLASKVKALPRQEREFVELTRQYEIVQQMYLFLLQKKEEAIFNLASITPKVKVIDPAMPGIKPIAPRAIRLLGIMVIVGCCIPFALLYIVYYYRNIFRRPEDSDTK